MTPLPAPLQALKQYPQFVAVKLTPDDEKPGKLKKLPINPHTLKAASSTDPSTWGTYEQAASVGLPVGFVLTEKDPFFCLDIDGAMQSDGQWSPLANELIAAIPGAAVEVSQSGRGLHIWGTAIAPAHKCKNIGLGIELYHKERFIALGLANAVGDAWQDFTAPLANVVSRYFPAVSATSLTGDDDADWDAGPCEEWRGSTDDADLIRRARAARPTAFKAISGGTFDDLWTANKERLAVAYPDMTKPGEYDASSADRALAQYLTFWTGKDCARVERLMRQSALVRDKWERESYMRATILGAARDQVDVCQDKAEPITPYDPTAGSPITGIVDSVAPMGEEAKVVYVHKHELATYFKGCIYVKNLDRAYVPGEGLVKKETFRVILGNAYFMTGVDSQKIETDAWAAFTGIDYKTPTAAGTCFRPDKAPGQLVDQQGEWYVNLYHPVPVPCAEGDVSLFLQHMTNLLPVEQDRTILLSYMAAVVQYPGFKFSWAPVVQGVEGNGKTLLTEVLSRAIGQKYVEQPTKKQLDKEFNSWMADKILVSIDDITIKRDLLEEFKTIITGKRASIETKGVDAQMRDVCCNFFFCCNPKDAVPKTATDRRYAPFFTAQQTIADLARCGMTLGYFDRLYNWLNGGGYSFVTHYLRNYAIPAEFNPAGSCQRAPTTSSTMEAVSLGLGSIEQEVQEEIAQASKGFRGGFVSQNFLRALLESKRRTCTPAKQVEIMATLGYVLHPALPNGRVNNIVRPDGVKPKLFVHRDNEALLAIKTAAEVARKYTDAQLDEHGEN